MTDTVNTPDPEHAQSIGDRAEALLDLLRDAKHDAEPFYVNDFVERLLAKFGKIAAIWSIEDVQGIRPDLTDEQASEVIEEVGRKRDAEYGINWTTLECTADILFPETTGEKETRPMKLNIIDITSHRNGICGAPFHVILFEDKGPDGSRKMAILLDEPHHCAVLDVAKLAASDIAFGSNSFRGDNYEPHLRQALAEPQRTAQALNPTADRRAIAVVSVRGGLVAEVRTNQPLHVLVEDWDGTEVRPSHDAIIPERMSPGEEAELADFFQPATNQGD